MSVLETCADVVRPLYQSFAGADAPLAAIPLALVRRVAGNFVVLRIDGRPIKVDLRDAVVGGEMLFLRRYEPDETALMKALVRRGDRVVDVGANIGYFTVLLATLVGEAGHVIALEPDPRNAELLAFNVAKNGVRDRVEIIRAAVSDVAGMGELHLSDVNFGDHRMWRPSDDRAPRSAVAVETIVLDDLLGDRHVDFMKIDIQGFEPRAFAGLQRTLSRRGVSMIAFEFWPYGMRGAGFDSREVLRDLWSHAMDLWLVGTAGLSRVVDLAFVETIADGAHVTLLATDRELAPERLAGLRARA